MPDDQDKTDHRAHLAVAQRLRAERELRGWTYTDTAAEMTRRGTPIDRTAVMRIESAETEGRPIRKVSVSELATLVAIFGGSADDWLRPMPGATEARREAAERAFISAVNAGGRARTATVEYVEAVADARRWFVQHPDDTALLTQFYTERKNADAESIALRVANDVTNATDLPQAEVWTFTERKDETMPHPTQELLHAAVLRCNDSFIATERYAAAIDEIADWLEAHPEGEQADEWLAFDQQQADEDEASLRREVFADVTNRLEERRNGLG